MSGTPSAPLIQISILASATPNGTYTSSLQVQAGETVYYEVLAQLAPVGTSNTQGSVTRTIKTKTAHPGIGTILYDGINSLSFNLADRASNPVQVNFAKDALATNPSTGDSWAAAIDASTGAAHGGQLLGVIAGQRPGGFAGAAGAEAVLTGSFTVAANAPFGKTSTIAGAWGGIDCGLGINSNPATGMGSTKIFATAATENGPSPLLGFAPLTLTTASAPHTRGTSARRHVTAKPA